MAEAILNHVIIAYDLHHMIGQIVICGAGRKHKNPTLHSIALDAIATRGISPPKSPIRKLRSSDFHAFDHIFVLDEDDMEELESFRDFIEGEVGDASLELFLSSALSNHHTFRNPSTSTKEDILASIETLEQGITRILTNRHVLTVRKSDPVVLKSKVRTGEQTEPAVTIEPTGSLRSITSTLRKIKSEGELRKNVRNVDVDGLQRLQLSWDSSWRDSLDDNSSGLVMGGTLVQDDMALLSRRVSSGSSSRPEMIFFKAEDEKGPEINPSEQQPLDSISEATTTSDSTKTDNLPTFQPKPLPFDRASFWGRSLRRHTICATSINIYGEHICGVESFTHFNFSQKESQNLK
jgi:protein-tyrosine-phosphatase